MFISKKTKAKIRDRRKKQLAASKTKTKGAASSSTSKSSTKRKLSAITPSNTNTATTSNSTTDDRIVDDDNNNAQQQEEEEEANNTNEEYNVTVPTGLFGKELKKFRKDARRTFRTRNVGVNEGLLQFVDEEGTPLFTTPDNTTNDNEENNDDTTPANDDDDDDDEQDTPPPPTTKKQRRIKVFPRINDLLAQAAETKLADKLQAKKDSYENSIPPSEKDKYVALDCEMVGIGAEGKQSALARVSITDWTGLVLLDTFVQVPDKVTDFRTFVSGVRAKDIKIGSKAMELHACRRKVGGILNGKVLVGHSLINDFKALMLNHPKLDVRDTARFKPFMCTSGRGGGKLRPRRLRDLAKEHLDLDLQMEGEEHSSVDDARATMVLYKLVRGKWEKVAEGVVAEKLKRSGKR